MANGTGVRGFLTAIAIVVLVGGTAILIESYPGDRVHDDVTTVPVTETAAGGRSSSAAAPVGGVATGGGGTAATDTGRLALPVFGALAAIVVLAGSAGIAWRQRMA